VRVTGGHTTQMCRILDTSFSGLRLGGLSVSLPLQSVVELQPMGSIANLPSPFLLRATVLRVDRGEAALGFSRDDAQTRGLAEQLMAAVARSWDYARELKHPAFCCGQRGVLEPPPPKLVRRPGVD
jgi:hypothetical protein